MSEDQISKKRVVYRVPGMESVTVRRDLQPLAMDIYYPADHSPQSKLPAVIFVSGYSDPGFEAMLAAS